MGAIVEFLYEVDWIGILSLAMRIVMVVGGLVVVGWVIDYFVEGVRDAKQRELDKKVSWSVKHWLDGHNDI